MGSGTAKTTVEMKRDGSQDTSMDLGHSASGIGALHLPYKIFCIITLLVATPGSTVSAHVLPDGFIVRGIQVVLQPDHISIEYQLGMSDGTLKTELARLESEKDEQDIESAGKTLEQYRAAVLPVIGRGLVVEFDGQQQKVQAVDASLEHRHHVRLRLSYRVNVGASVDAASIVITDENFRDADGYHLMALKGRNVTLTRSSAPLTVGRARWIPVSEMDADQKAAARTITATYHVASSPG